MKKVNSSKTVSVKEFVESKVREGKKMDGLAGAQVPAVSIERQEIDVKAIASEIIKGTVAVGEKYVTLCTYIRSNQVQKKNATKWLVDLGFSKPRASEVCRVSYSDDKTWSAFAAKSIGWRGVLQITRGNVEELRQLAPASFPAELDKQIGEEIESESPAETDEKYAGLSETERAAKIKEDKKAGWLKSFEAAGVRVCKLAELLGLRSKTFNTLNGYEVVVRKVKKAKIVDVSAEVEKSERPEVNM